MLFDCHIHVRGFDANYKKFRADLDAAGVDGGIVLSLSPSSGDGNRLYTAEERIQNVLDWVDSDPNLFSFFFIDPIAPDALDQVGLSVAKGVKGFKVICGKHYPGDERAIPVYQAIADAGKPMLFHSGILWDGQPSAKFNRPGNFEDLLQVKNIRFALAHISWPWCDELVAVYGKFLNSYTDEDGFAGEMLVDITPGTPPLFRREALMKLFCTGYDVQNNIMFGTDCNTAEYNTPWLKEWLERDAGIFAELGVDMATVQNVYSENLKRFVGVNPTLGKPKAVRMGES